MADAPLLSRVGLEKRVNSKQRGVPRYAYGGPWTQFLELHRHACPNKQGRPLLLFKFTCESYVS